jgi:hypothetical protein
MGSYFRQLIHQTGVHIEGGTGAVVQGLAPDSRLAPEPPTTTLQEVNEHRLVPPTPTTPSPGEEEGLQANSLPWHSRQVTDDSQNPASATLDGTRRNSPSDRDVLREELEQRSFAEPNYKPPTETVEIYTEPTHGVTSGDGPQHSADQYANDEFASLPHSALEVDSVEAVGIPDSPSMSSKAGRLSPKWQMAMTQLREWVSETPAPGEIAAGQLSVGEGMQVAARPVRFIDKRDHTEPDIQDFQFSVGSIHLTIEEPPDPNQDHLLPRERGAHQSPTGITCSRLRRHYLRF